jgi:HlyD family secretion protein
MNKNKLFIVLLITISLFSCGYLLSPSAKNNAQNLVSVVQKRNLSVSVHSIGELEASKSAVISSKLGTDQAKVVYIIDDGSSVSQGDLLIKIDPSYYENRIEELKAKIKDQKSVIESLAKTLEWEISQKDVDKHIAQSELFLAQLEYDKAVNKEGQMEEKKLQAAIDKSTGKIGSLERYHSDLLQLAKEGYVNDFEIRQTLNKIKDEKENLELAKEQYLCYVETTFPMIKHKAEAALKKASIKASEAEDNSKCKIFKAENNLIQAKSNLEDLKYALFSAEQDLQFTEMRAPTDGMVVLKEDFRAGQRRKTKIGDVLNKNQPILDLPDLSQMLVRTRIREVDLHKIQIGKEASIEVDAFPELTFHGRITYLGVLALKDPMRSGEEKFFDVHIVLNEKNSCLRPGMTVRVTIHSQNIENAITIPYQSLFEGEDQNKYCYVHSWNRYQKRPIKVGTVSDEWVVVESGLKEGERVCLTLPQQEIDL